MAAFAEETQQLEFDISEGRVRKYAVIGNLDIEFRYEEIEDEEREMTVNEGQDDEHKVFVTVVPPSPLEGCCNRSVVTGKSATSISRPI